MYNMYYTVHACINMSVLIHESMAGAYKPTNIAHTHTQVKSSKFASSNFAVSSAPSKKRTVEVCHVPWLWVYVLVCSVLWSINPRNMN